MATGRDIRPARPDTGYGLPASLVLHAGLAAAALVAWQATPPMTDPDPVIAVDVITDAPEATGLPFEGPGAGLGEEATAGEDVTVAVPADQEPAPAPAPDPGLPPSVAPETAPPPSATAPPPPPLPPPPKAKSPPPPPPPPPARAAAPQRPPPPARPSPPPAARPSPPPARPQTSNAAARPSPPAARPSAQPTSPPPAEPGAQASRSRETSPKFDVPGAANGAASPGRAGPDIAGQGSGRTGGRNGNGTQLSGDLRGMLRSQISQTYDAPSAMRAGERIVVVLEITLDRDGRVRGNPRVVAPTGYESNDLARNAVETAMRAVLRRRQFDLPEDRYAEWQNFQFRFDPRELIN